MVAIISLISIRIRAAIASHSGHSIRQGSPPSQKRLS